MSRKIAFYLTLAFMSAALQLSAQQPAKYGHMNLGNLLETLPETKKANDDLKAFTDKFSMKDDSLTKAFQEDVNKYQTDYQAGKLPPVQAAQIEEELQKKQQAIQAFEQDAQQQVAAKREELLAPILKKVEDAIKAVAKREGYLMVFDSSTGLMLFASDSEDVTTLVKKELGVQ